MTEHWQRNSDKGQEGSPCTLVGYKGNKRGRSGWRPEPQRGSWRRGKFAMPGRICWPAGIIAGPGKEIYRLGEEHNSQIVSGRAEEDIHRWSCNFSSCLRLKYTFIDMGGGAGCWSVRFGEQKWMLLAIWKQSVGVEGWNTTTRNVWGGGLATTEAKWHC